MSATKTLSTRPGYCKPPHQVFSKVGEPLDASPSYPSFHESGNEGYKVVYSVNVDDGIVQVVSDGGHHEWLWAKESGEVVYTQMGWGSVAYALHDALSHAHARIDTKQEPDEETITRLAEAIGTAAVGAPWSVKDYPLSYATQFYIKLARAAYKACHS